MQKTSGLLQQRRSKEERFAPHRNIPFHISVSLHFEDNNSVITLCIRYTLNPNKLTDFKTYVAAELGPIRRSGGETFGYFLPTDFAGPTNEALGLIDFRSLAEYEQYRNTLANDQEHKQNVARLEQSGAIVAMNRSVIERVG
jgi:hypothetical protein